MTTLTLFVVLSLAKSIDIAVKALVPLYLDCKTSLSQFFIDLLAYLAPFSTRRSHSSY